MRNRWGVIAFGTLIVFALGASLIFFLNHARDDTPEEQENLKYYDAELARLVTEEMTRIRDLKRIWDARVALRTVSPEDIKSHEAHEVETAQSPVAKLQTKLREGEISNGVYLEAKSILLHWVEEGRVKNTPVNLNSVNVDDLLARAIPAAAAKRDAFKKEPLKLQAASLVQEIAELEIEKRSLESQRDDLAEIGRALMKEVNEGTTRSNDALASDLTINSAEEGQVANQLSRNADEISRKEARLNAIGILMKN